MTPKPKPSWRDVLPIHPAAELFPRPPPDERRTLRENIKANGLQTQIAIWDEGEKLSVLDGITRLDVLEELGSLIIDVDGVWLRAADGTPTLPIRASAKYIDADTCKSDPYALAFS